MFPFQAGGGGASTLLLVVSLLALLVHSGAFAAVHNVPDIEFIVNPAASSTIVTEVAPTCRPTILNTVDAILCYSIDGMHAAQFVDPSDPSVAFPSVVSHDSSLSLNHRPVALTSDTALVYSSDALSSYVYVFSTTEPLINVVDRRGSTLDVIFDEDSQMVLVPIGGPNPVLQVFSVADIIVANHTSVPAWSFDLSELVGSSSTSPMVTARSNIVMVLTNFTVNMLNVTAGTITTRTHNPCDFDETSTNVSLDVFYTSTEAGHNDDHDGVDASLILAFSGNTSLGPLTALCRLNITSGEKLWRTDFPGALTTVVDVSGGAATLYVTGWFALESQPAELLTWSMNASSGKHGSTVVRSSADEYSTPAVVSAPFMACNEMVVMQVNGITTSYCDGDMKTPVWTVAVGCTFQAAVDHETKSFACVTQTSSVTLLSGTGAVVWMSTSLRPAFGAVIVDSLVWIVDVHSTLFGLSLHPFRTRTRSLTLPAAAPPASLTASGVRPGTIVGACLGAVVGVFIIVVVAVKVNKKRQLFISSKSDLLDEEGEEAPMRNTGTSYGGYGSV